MYTEEQAKQKACPLTMVRAETDLCLGSLCMAWRFAADEVSSGPNIGVKKWSNKGYCGLADNPLSMAIAVRK